MLTQDDRERFIKQLSKPSSSIGIDIPRYVTLSNQTIDLHERLRELRKIQRLSDEEIEDIEDLMADIKGRIAEIKRALTHDALTRISAEALYQEGLGLKRAKAALRGILEPEKKGWGRKHTTEHELEDTKRWIEYMKKIK